MSSCPPSQRRSTIVLAALALLISACAERPPSVSESLEVELTDANFQSVALDSDKPMLVEFGASWCGPCREMEPALAALSVEYQDRLQVGKIDVDENLQLTRDYQIEAVPTFLILSNGEVVARETAFMPYEHLIRWVDANLPQ